MHVLPGIRPSLAGVLVGVPVGGGRSGRVALVVEHDIVGGRRHVSLTTAQLQVQPAPRISGRGRAHAHAAAAVYKQGLLGIKVRNGDCIIIVIIRVSVL